MAEKGFGVKKISFVQPSGSPTLTSPNNINLNAVNVAISTDVSIGATCTAYEFSGAIASWEIGNDGSDHYSFKGPGFDGGTRFDPDIHLVRGQRYIFHNRSSGHPFRIQSTPNGSAGTQYNTGVTNNDGAAPTDIVFDVPQDAPALLYYQCTAHPSMGGKLIIDYHLLPFHGVNSGAITITSEMAGQIINLTGVASNSVDFPANALSPGEEITIVNNQSQVNCNLSALGGSTFVDSLSGAATWGNGGTVTTSIVLATRRICKVLCVEANVYYAYG